MRAHENLKTDLGKTVLVSFIRTPMLIQERLEHTENQPYVFHQGHRLNSRFKQFLV